jgi:hypothetical protein
VVWLGSAECKVNGRVFNIRAGHVSVAEGWRVGPAYEKTGPFDVAEMNEHVPAIVTKSEPQRNALGKPKVYEQQD